MQKEKNQGMSSYDGRLVESNSRLEQCDEQKPSCQRCEKRGFECLYSSLSESSPSEKSLDLSSTSSDPSTICFSFSLDKVMNGVEETLSLDPKWTPHALTSPGSTHPMSGVAFQHFINCSTETIASPAIRGVMRTDMIRVSFTVRPSINVFTT